MGKDRSSSERIARGRGVISTIADVVAIVAFLIPFIPRFIHWSALPLTLRRVWLWISMDRFSVWNLFVFVIVAAAVIYLGGRFWSRSRRSKIDRLLNSDSELVLSERQCKITWQAYYNENEGVPRTYVVHAYCLRHGDTPLEMPWGRCVNKNCPNCLSPLDMDKVKVYINSILLDRIKEL